MNKDIERKLKAIIHAPILLRFQSLEAAEGAEEKAIAELITLFQIESKAYLKGLIGEDEDIMMPWGDVWVPSDRKRGANELRAELRKKIEGKV